MLKIAGGIILGFFGLLIAIVLIFDAAVYAGESEGNSDTIEDSLTDNEALKACESALQLKLNKKDISFKTEYTNVLSITPKVKMITDRAVYYNGMARLVQDIYTCKLSYTDKEWTAKIVGESLSPAR